MLRAIAGTPTVRRLRSLLSSCLPGFGPQTFPEQPHAVRVRGLDLKLQHGTFAMCPGYTQLSPEMLRTYRLEDGSLHQWYAS
jgi:hypothetical protein